MSEDRLRAAVVAERREQAQPLATRRVAPERVAMVLAGIQPRNIAFFRADLAGVALEATDLDWSHGTGAPVRGLAQDLLLVLCGRHLPPGRLKGEAATRFSG